MTSHWITGAPNAAQAKHRAVWTMRSSNIRGMGIRLTPGVSSCQVDRIQGETDGTIRLRHLVWAAKTLKRAEVIRGAEAPSIPRSGHRLTLAKLLQSHSKRRLKNRRMPDSVGMPPQLQNGIDKGPTHPTSTAPPVKVASGPGSTSAAGEQISVRAKCAKQAQVRSSAALLLGQTKGESRHACSFLETPSTF